MSATAKINNLKKRFACSEGIQVSMENQATKTFRTGRLEWKLHGSDAVVSNHDAISLPRRWRAINEGNGLSILADGSWKDDVVAEHYFDHQCKLALRALVGPPPWEQAAQAEHTAEAINKIGDRLCSLSNEAEHGFAELKAIAVRLIGERDRLDGELQAVRPLLQDFRRFDDRLNQAIKAHQEDPPHHLLAPLASALQLLPYQATSIIANALDEMPYLHRSEDAREWLRSRATEADYKAGRLEAELHRERTTLSEVVKANEQCKRERDAHQAECARLRVELCKSQAQVEAVTAERDIAANLDRRQRELITRLTNERDKWIADFREVTARATRLQGELDRAVEVRKSAEDQNTKLIAASCEHRERLKSIEAAFIAANDIAIQGNDRPGLLQASPRIACGRLCTRFAT